jgi:hypothetical protein
MLLAAVAVALGGLVAAGCSEQSAAVRVGDATVSQSDFEAELDAFGTNDVLAASGPDGESGLFGDLSPSYSQDLVGYVLQRRVLFTVAEAMVDERRLDVTDDDRSTAEQQLTSEFMTQSGDGFAAFAADYRRRLTEDYARLVRLQDDVGADDLDQELRAAFDSTDIEVSSHYGTWDPDHYTVVPPEGPAPAPDGGSSSETTAGG